MVGAMVVFGMFPYPIMELARAAVEALR
jgi:hypothetical protein